MSMPQQPTNPYDSPEFARPGMGTGGKVLLGLGLGCGLLMLLCCGFFGISGYWFSQALVKSISSDPVAIRDLTDSIVSMEIPAGLEPQFSMDLHIPIVGQIAMVVWTSGAVSEESTSGSGLLISQMDNPAVNREDLRKQFESEFRETQNGGLEEIRLEKSEAIDLTINGALAQFTFGSGKRKDGVEVWQVTGSFDGKGGPAMLLMQLVTDSYTEEQVRATVQSMADPDTEAEESESEIELPAIDNGDTPATEAEAVEVDAV